MVVSCLCARRGGRGLDAIQTNNERGQVIFDFLNFVLQGRLAAELAIYGLAFGAHVAILFAVVCRDAVNEKPTAKGSRLPAFDALVYFIHSKIQAKFRCHRQRHRRRYLRRLPSGRSKYCH